jgi:AcrR family transcriptional regulator
MARPRSQDYDAIKIKILDSSAELFAQKGYANTSIAEIAETSGLSKSGLYHYFESKHNILHTILDEYVAIVLDSISAVLQSSQNPIKQFELLTLSLLETYNVSKYRHVVLLNELDSLEERARKGVVDLERRIIDLTESIIVKIKPELAGRVAKRPVVMLFFGMINWTYTWFQSERGLSLGSLATLTSGIFINGLLAEDITNIINQSY